MSALGGKLPLDFGSEELGFVHISNAKVFCWNSELLRRLLHEGHGTLKPEQIALLEWVGATGMLGNPLADYLGLAESRTAVFRSEKTKR